MIRRVVAGFGTYSTTSKEVEKKTVLDFRFGCFCSNRYIALLSVSLAAPQAGIVTVPGNLADLSESTGGRVLQRTSLGIAILARCLSSFSEHAFCLSIPFPSQENNSHD